MYEVVDILRYEDAIAHLKAGNTVAAKSLSKFFNRCKKNRYLLIVATETCTLKSAMVTSTTSNLGQQIPKLLETLRISFS